MLILATPIVIPNINRVDPIKVIDNRDDDVPSFCLTVRFYLVGGRDGGTFTICAYNSRNSSMLEVNPTPAGAGDSIVLRGAVQVDNACTSLGAAYDAAGTRAAKRAAVYAKALEIGLLGPGLATT